MQVLLPTPLENMFNLSKRDLVTLLLIAAAFLLGWLVSREGASSPVKTVQLRENSFDYHFINPLFLVDNSQVVFSDFEGLQDELGYYIDKAKEKEEIDSASVYFRDLNSGRWTGVNEREKYKPSSMLKVATLIGYLRLVYANPSILELSLPYKPVVDKGQWYQPSQYLSQGNQKVKVLLQEMIVRSENTAAKVLEDPYIEDMLSVYDDLSLPDPVKKQGVDDDFMSPEEYSRLFRVLYNSTFLPQSYSETALQLLSLTEFKNGLVAELPPKLLVSHKFGEHTMLVDGQLAERQLHDCGIIYFPEHPYFLCVMTKGLEFADLEKVISNLSKIAYDYVRGRYEE